MSAIGTLSRDLGHGRKSGVNPRISYEVALPPRLSLAYNPYHLPAGSPNSTGGRFTNREGAITAVADRSGEDRLRRMKEALDRRPDLPAAVREASIEIFDAEGRGAIDPHSGAAGGIRGIAIAQARIKKTPGLEGVKRPADLSYDQMVSVYNVSIDFAMEGAGGSRRLDNFTDRRTAIAVADTVFAHGRRDSGKMLVQAATHLLESISSWERDRLGLPKTATDRSVALDVLEVLSNYGYAQQVRTAIADQRRNWVQEQENEIRNNAKLSDTEKRKRLRRHTGWRPRIARFE